MGNEFETVTKYYTEGNSDKHSSVRIVRKNLDKRVMTENIP